MGNLDKNIRSASPYRLGLDGLVPSAWFRKCCGVCPLKAKSGGGPYGIDEVFVIVRGYANPAGSGYNNLVRFEESNIVNYLIRFCGPKGGEW